MHAPYNTVPIWDYAALFQAFGPEFKTKSYLVKTPDQLDEILADAVFNEASCAQVCLLFDLTMNPADACVDCRIDT